VQAGGSERLQDVEDLLTRQPEDVVDALVLQAADEELSGALARDTTASSSALGRGVAA
jgi:hypothetical protein